MEEVYEAISPAEFFYKNQDIAGFDNPTRATYTTVREAIENSLDACEEYAILPDIYLRLRKVSGDIYQIYVEDNGGGVPPEHIPNAFGRVLFGSKYRVKQTRGTFGLGIKMAILYGQIRTNKPVQVISSTGTREIYEFTLMIDIQKNEPIIISKEVHENHEEWHGTIIQFHFEGNYRNSKGKILGYLKQTAMAVPYANITFADPNGMLYHFSRAITEPPRPPREVLPHPRGVDIELLKRMIRNSKEENMIDFLSSNFQRVGEKIALNLLNACKLDPYRKPSSLTESEIEKIAETMTTFKGFLPPDSRCLAPIGEVTLRKGIEKELHPEKIFVVTRKPSAYSGHPFIVEAAIAYGGKTIAEALSRKIQKGRGAQFLLYRFTNKIPLLYDEVNDVVTQVIQEKFKKWGYRFSLDDPENPVAIIVHICSTKIPYKTVGKEYVADRPEISREIELALKYVCRQLDRYLLKKHIERRLNMRKRVFSKYLKLIARFSAKIAEREPPDIAPLIGENSNVGTKQEK